MTPQIVEKLENEVRAGLATESQVVYVLAGIRKILEQEGSSSSSKYLKFHCDWALHSRLQGPSAQEVLQHFGRAYDRLLNGDERVLNDETELISKMENFRQELSDFLRSRHMTDFSTVPGAWSKFLYLYSRVIEDAPLVIRERSDVGLGEVVVKVEMSKDKDGDHQVFKVSWNMKIRYQESVVISVFNSFE